MKKYLLGIVAVMLAIGFSAFTEPQSKTKGNFTLKYFTYDDFPNDSWKDEPSHYTMTANGGQTIPSCNGTEKRCAVRAEENGGTGDPVLSGAVILEKDLE